jgi:hypothetical protein
MSNAFLPEEIMKFTEPGHYLYRNGKLPEPIISAGKDTNGVITAPADFFKAKYVNGDMLTNENVLFRFTDMLVSYSIEDGTVFYEENIASNEGSTKIKGSLKLNPDLKVLGINTQKTYTSQALADVLKFNRLLFKSPDECMNMVSKLKKFSATIATEIVNSNDNQGNKNLSYAQKIATEMNLSFTLSCTLFSGRTEAITFKVDIEFDLRDKAIEFWLVSVELKEIMDTTKEVIVLDEVSIFKNKGVPCIQYS